MKVNRYGDPNMPSILFIHGGGVGGWMWEEQIQYFQKRFYILVPELPLTNPHFSIDKTAEELNHLIALETNQKVILVGFSIGAQISIAMISKGSDQFSAAMINSALVKPIQNRFMDLSVKYSYPLTKSRVFAKLQASSMRVPKKHFNTYFNDSLNYSREAFLNMMKENMRFHVQLAFYNTKIPILFTIGSKEQNLVKTSLEELKSNSLNATHYIFNGVGHNAPFTAAIEFNRLLDKWLKEVLNHG